jgi:hypothetical protein
MREAVAAAMADGVTESGSQLHPLPQRLLNIRDSDVGIAANEALFSGNITNADQRAADEVAVTVLEVAW